MRQESTIIRISFKSAIFIILVMLSATLLLPLILELFNLKLLPLRVLAIGVSTGWAFSHTIFIRETDKGYTKGYWVTFILITILTSFISYFWVYDIYYI